MPFSTSDYLKTPRSKAALLMATYLLVIGAGLGLRDTWPADQSRFALTAWKAVTGFSRIAEGKWTQISLRFSCRSRLQS